MSQSQVSDTIRPRLANTKDTARYMGMSVSSFHAGLKDWTKNGFPEQIPMFNKYDLDAIDDFLDALSGRKKSAWFGNTRKGGDRGKAFS